LALFYVNLLLQEIVSEEKITTMLEDLQTNMLQNIKKEGCANIVDEMSEVIYILAINGAPKLKVLGDEWSATVNRITHISTLKAKSEPSISNKTIFKHMDMLTALNKV
jgi:hypothetical protein